MISSRIASGLSMRVRTSISAISLTLSVGEAAFPRHVWRYRRGGLAPRHLGRPLYVDYYCFWVCIGFRSIESHRAILSVAGFCISQLGPKSALRHSPRSNLVNGRGRFFRIGRRLAHFAARSGLVDPAQSLHTIALSSSGMSVLFLEAV